MNAITTRKNYKPEVKMVPFSELPFVHRSKRGNKTTSNWNVPPTSDYGAACRAGREYAGHFIQYLKDNPGMVGGNMLGNIAKDIDFTDDTGAKGYWAGFFSHLEALIHGQAQRIDVFGEVDKINAYYDEIAARRDAEEAGGEERLAV